MNTLEIFAEPADPHLGTALRGRYRLDSFLGCGAMGTVYRAWDLELEAPCAVKLLRIDGRMRDAARVRFLDEARIVTQIFHPNIVEMYDHGTEPDGSLFLVMELLHGQDLDALLKVEERLPLSQTLDIIRQLGSALHAVHQAGVVHRDIKPRNIFLVNRGSSDHFVVKLIDFGLAKHLHPITGDRGSDGLLIGTPEYLPPEAWRGVSADVDTRADQWALAVLSFRLLSGQLPFANHLDTMLLGKEIINGAPRRIRELVPVVPEYVEKALLRALSQQKEERFKTIHDFVRALLRLGPATAELSDRSTEIRVTAPPPPPQSCQTALLPVSTIVLPAAGLPADSAPQPIEGISWLSASSPLALACRAKLPLRGVRYALAGIVGLSAIAWQGTLNRQMLASLQRVEHTARMAEAASLSSSEARLEPAAPYCAYPESSRGKLYPGVSNAVVGSAVPDAETAHKGRQVVHGTKSARRPWSAGVARTKPLLDDEITEKGRVNREPL